MRYGRQISSLRFLLSNLGIEFEVKQNPKWVDETHRLTREDGLALGEAIKIAKEKFPPEERKQYLAEVESYKRDDCSPPADLGTRYGIINYDQDALDTGENLMSMLGDLEHAAQCGCDGCAGRTNTRIESYRRKKEGGK